MTVEVTPACLGRCLTPFPVLPAVSESDCLVCGSMEGYMAEGKSYKKVKEEMYIVTECHLCLEMELMSRRACDLSKHAR